MSSSGSSISGGSGGFLPQLPPHVLAQAKEKEPLPPVTERRTSQVGPLPPILHGRKITPPPSPTAEHTHGVSLPSLTGRSSMPLSQSIKDHVRLPSLGTQGTTQKSDQQGRLSLPPLDTRGRSASAPSNINFSSSLPSLTKANSPESISEKDEEFSGNSQLPQSRSQLSNSNAPLRYSSSGIGESMVNPKLQEILEKLKQKAKENEIIIEEVNDSDVEIEEEEIEIFNDDDVFEVHVEDQEETSPPISAVDPDESDVKNQGGVLNSEVNEPIDISKQEHILGGILATKSFTDISFLGFTPQMDKELVKFAKQINSYKSDSAVIAGAMSLVEFRKNYLGLLVEQEKKGVVLNQQKRYFSNHFTAFLKKIYIPLISNPQTRATIEDILLPKRK